MSALDLRPRSASEIVDAAFRLLRRHYGAFVRLAAVTYVPMLLFELLKLGVRSGSGSAAVATVLVAPLTIVFYALAESALMVLASDVYHTGAADVGAALRRALPRVLPAAGALVLMTLAIGAGLVLLLLPGVYVACRIYTSMAATVLEPTGPTEGFSRTWARTRGRVRHVAATGLLVFLLYIVLLVGAGVLVAAVTSIDDPLWELGVSAIVQVLVYPMLPIVSTLLYYDLRIRSEGYDVEVLSGQLGAPLGATAAGP